MRITRTTKKDINLREKTLKQMRDLRAKFEGEHPDLMAKIKSEVQKQALYAQELAKIQERPEALADETIIDKKKNLSTVMTLAEKYQGSPEFQKKLKQLLIGAMNS